MKYLAATAAALLLVSIVVACSHSSRHPASAIEAAAAAREQAIQKAHAAAAAQDEDRQQLATVPLPTKSIYMAIHTRPSWNNPFVVVGSSSVNLSIMYPDNGPANDPASDLLRPAGARRRVLDLRLSDLPEALVALPGNTWPYGRVIAVQEDPFAPRQDRAQVRRNVETTMQILSDLGIVIYEWPSSPR